MTNPDALPPAFALPLAVVLCGYLAICWIRDRKARR